jgi:hypothetical protein
MSLMDVVVVVCKELIIMTTIQKTKIEEIKQQVITKLLYTERYTLNEFNIDELDNGDVRVTFEIKRTDYHGPNVYQTGELFVTPRGKMYYLNFMGNKKTVTTIQSVVGPFYER